VDSRSIYATAHLANSASLLLPISNLTSLLVFFATRPVQAQRSAAGLLPQAAFLVLWSSVGAYPSTAAGDVLIALSSLAMGIQSAAIFSLGLRAVFTTAITATVTVFSADFAGWAQPRSERYRLLAVALGVFAGAALGAFFLDHAQRWAPVLPLGLSAFAVAAAAAAFGIRTR